MVIPPRDAPRAPDARRVHPRPAVAARPRRAGRGRVPGHLLPGRGPHRRGRGHRDRPGQRAGVRGPAGLGRRAGPAGSQLGRRHRGRRAGLRCPGPGARTHRSRRPGGRHRHPARRAGRAVLRRLLARRPHAHHGRPPRSPGAGGDVRCGGSGRAAGRAGQRHRMARHLARCRGGAAPGGLYHVPGLPALRARPAQHARSGGHHAYAGRARRRHAARRGRPWPAAASAVLVRAGRARRGAGLPCHPRAPPTGRDRNGEAIDHVSAGGAIRAPGGGCARGATPARCARPPEPGGRPLGLA